MHNNKGEKMRILITGSTSGIIKDLFPILINKGHFLYMTTHTELEKEKLEEKYGKSKFYAIEKLDITNKNDRKKIEKKKIDCLILNAAVGVGGSFLDVPIDVIKDTYETNVFSNLDLAKTYINKCINEKKKGKIILISSLITKIPIPFTSVYASSKSSSFVFFSTLAKELKNNPYISIKIVLPGAYYSGFNQRIIDLNDYYITKKSIFFQDKEEINTTLKFIFSIIEKREFSSIHNKIIKAIEDNSNRLYYKAPFSSAFFLKLYQLFFQ